MLPSEKCPHDLVTRLWYLVPMFTQQAPFRETEAQQKVGHWTSNTL